MTQTCVLRGDYYHLMEQIWPKAFGFVLMKNMSKYLRVMLLSNTKFEWDKAYGYALNFVITDPVKREVLYEIYDNPSYYAGFYLKTIAGNLCMLGSVCSEQNHASNVAYLGKGANWSIMEQIAKLMTRHQQHWKEQN